MELQKREEIVKALECHASGKLVECEQCPLDKAHLFNATCVQTMCENALTLIKELIEEIKDLEADYDRVYEQAEADIHANMADGGTSCHWCMDKTRVDTVKRMQERLKELYTDEIITDDMTVAIGVIKQNIDDVAKELTEGKNDV